MLKARPLLNAFTVSVLQQRFSWLLILIVDQPVLSDHCPVHILGEGPWQEAPRVRVSRSPFCKASDKPLSFLKGLDGNNGSGKAQPSWKADFLTVKRVLNTNKLRGGGGGTRENLQSSGRK